MVRNGGLLLGLLLFAFSAWGDEKAVRIYFQQSTTTDTSAKSFDVAPSTGTTPGAGFQATRLFKPDGTLLDTAVTSDPKWPKVPWISSVEVGLSGSTNTAAKNSNCAKFAASYEATQQCSFDGTGTTNMGNCGALNGFYRVSEYDCMRTDVGTAAASAGTGGPNDGIYIRVTFNRDTSKLGANENILAILQYTSTAVYQGPKDPSTCFNGGAFNPTSDSCTDFLWNIYLRSSTNTAPQPFLILAPPMVSYVNFSKLTGGGGSASRQFVLPLAGDSTLNVLQISRIFGRATTDNTYQKTCFPSNNTSPALSANCMGMVFYSLTLFRI